jgi:uncharacterized membrane protein (DUF441 family)
MSSTLLPLIMILVIALFSKNMTIFIATAILLCIKMTPIQNSVLLFIEKKGLSVGVVLLTMYVLTPLANGKINLNMIFQACKSQLGLIALVTGGVVAWIAAKGIPLMSSSPETITALMIGTIIGVCFFKGLPVGPLIAAGVVALIHHAIK